MTRTSRHARSRPSNKKKHYRSKTINIVELRTKPLTVTPRVFYVQNPYYEQLECGSKTVEARPNYPCFRDIVPGTIVEFINRYSDTSFTAKITSRRVHRNFHTMLKKETIQACLPDHDPEDLQRAVNTYHSFRHGTYKFIVRKHGVVSFRFTHIDNLPKHSTHPPKTIPPTKIDWGEYNRNSLCSIFEVVKRKRIERKFPRFN